MQQSPVVYVVKTINNDLKNEFYLLGKTKARKINGAMSLLWSFSWIHR